MKVDRSEIRQNQLIENLMTLHEVLCKQGKGNEAIELTRFLQKQLKNRGKEIIDIIPKQDSERGQKENYLRHVLHVQVRPRKTYFERGSPKLMEKSGAIL